MKYQDNNQEEEVNGAKVFPTNDYRQLPNGFEDMVDMENLCEAELLYNLRERYKVDKIFTYVGPTLIVLNPYFTVPGLLTPENLKLYHGLVKNEKATKKDFEPHVYFIAGESLRNVAEFQKNQALVISGESGAGKTENTKYAMKYLTSYNDGEKKAGEVSIEDKVSNDIVDCVIIMANFFG